MAALSSWPADDKLFGRAGKRTVSDTEPIVPFRQRLSDTAAGLLEVRRDVAPTRISFDRTELAAILTVYGSKVADGEWRDYAIDAGSDKAVFSVFRRTADTPLYRIEKNPRLARRQGAYAVVAQGGMILRRGHDLAQVLRVLFRRPKLVTV
jgi:hypothetical protein